MSDDRKIPHLNYKDIFRYQHPNERVKRIRLRDLSRKGVKIL